jgi:hypothetical protein
MRSSGKPGMRQRFRRPFFFRWKRSHTEREE